MNSQILIIAAFMMALSFSAFGSGSGGSGGGSRGSYNDGGSAKSPTDPVYEYGKKIFKGKVKAYPKIKFCLVSEGAETGIVHIKGKTIKPFKGQSYQQLAEQLRNCKDASQTGLSILERNDMLSLLYFLNKRYRLKLS